MSYEMINPVKQFNFQINRVLIYGEAACDMNAVRRETASIKTLADWNKIWTQLAREAVKKKEYLHAAYAFRMVEFFLKESDSRKEAAYQNSISNYYLAFDKQLHLNYEKHRIPFEGGFLNCLKIPVERSRGVLLLCGGYDSKKGENSIARSEIHSWQSIRFWNGWTTEIYGIKHKITGTWNQRFISIIS